MSNEVYTSALKSTLQEIQNVCPDVTSNLLFKDGKLLAKDQNTAEESAVQTIESFNELTKRAVVIGDVETVTIQSVKGKVDIADINDFYLATVSSKEADEKYVNTLTRVLIPIVIKLVDQIQPASIENEEISRDDEAITTIKTEPVEEVMEYVADKPEGEETDSIDFEALEEEEAMRKLNEDTEPAEPEVYYEPLLPEPPVTQLIVENLKGFRVPSDTVRVDKETITQWEELYSDKKIEEIEIEALNGKTTRCKVNEIKKSKDSGKGIIKMPEKIQVTLEIAAGELVTVKPVVEN